MVGEGKNRVYKYSEKFRNKFVCLHSHSWNRNPNALLYVFLRVCMYVSSSSTMGFGSGGLIYVAHVYISVGKKGKTRVAFLLHFHLFHLALSSRWANRRALAGEERNLAPVVYVCVCMYVFNDKQSRTRLSFGMQKSASLLFLASAKSPLYRI